MTCEGRIKTIFKTALFLITAQICTVFAFSALAQEITAINFDGEILGKVIPDGKVVGADNKLIGNVTADSFIVGFDGKLLLFQQAHGNDSVAAFDLGMGCRRTGTGQESTRSEAQGEEQAEYADPVFALQGNHSVLVGFLWDSITKNLKKRKKKSQIVLDFL